MKIFSFKTYPFTVFCFAFLSPILYAQEDKMIVNQDPKFEQLLNEKRKINSSINVNDHYKIQIYSGESETAKKTLYDFRKDNNFLDGTIVFSTPIYKVWVGNFNTRIEAERELANFKTKYPNAFLIKPNK